MTGNCPLFRHPELVLVLPAYGSRMTNDQVQDGERWGEGVGSTAISGMTQLLLESSLSLQTYTQNAVFL